MLVGSHGLGSVFDAIAAIRSLKPDVKIIVTSASTSDEAILRAISAGVKGYLRRSSPGRSLHTGAADSEWRLNLGAAAGSGQVRRAGDRKSHRKLTSHNLSDRERQVLELLVAGRTNKEIGDELGIEERTVKLHISRLMQKVGVDNRIALSVYAVTKLLFSGG